MKRTVALIHQAPLVLLGTLLEACTVRVHQLGVQSARLVPSAVLVLIN